MASLSFAQDIRPLFRETDVEEMIDVAGFDLSRYEDVRDRALDIYERLGDGSMPCDGAWPADQVARFKQWMDDGMAP
ncbi:MAG TPA: hypothetical protein VFL17_14265 [Anaerolineae bacterium]|nr:hypothetical protein [Anaerolineae bacterium]